MALFAVAAVAAYFQAGLRLAALPSVSTWQAGTAMVLFVAAFFLLETRGVTFRWRDLSISTSLSESAIFVGLMVLPWPLLVLLVPIPRLAMHFQTQRPAAKGLVNVALAIVSTTAAGWVFMLGTALGWHPLVAAAVGTLAHTVTSDGSLSLIFGALERVSPLRVYRERFLLPSALAVSFGASAGAVVVSLYAYDPFAAVAILPLIYLVLTYNDFQARADRELGVHRRLAVVAQDLVGSQDEEAIADPVLATAADLLDAGRVRLELADGRHWERTTNSAVHGPAALAVNVTERSGERLGSLSAWHRPGKPDFGAGDAEVLRIIAVQTAHALGSVRALAETAQQRDLIARQEKLSALGTMLAGVAHEINNPLTYMKTRVALAEMETDDVLESDDATEETRGQAERVRRHLDPIKEGIGRLEELCNSLKMTAKPGSGDRVATDMNAVVKHVLTIVKAVYKQADFVVDLDPDLPDVKANAGELHQVLLNMTKNAAEAVSDQDGASIAVTTRRVGANVAVEVADNGPGIPAEAQDKLFTPFYTTKEAGTGLGLSISHGIVAAHGGGIELDSRPGEGTRFTVTLPALPHPAPADATGVQDGLRVP